MTVGLVSIANPAVVGFRINLTFDSFALAAPASFRTNVQQAASLLMASISNAIDINIEVGYDSYNGASFPLGNGAQGQTDGPFPFITYDQVRAGFPQGNATQTSYFSTLPSGSTTIQRSRPDGKVIGLVAARDGARDGLIGIGSGVSTTSLIGVALHELTHAMGRAPGISLWELSRWTSAGVRGVGVGPTVANYFSLDSGTARLADNDDTNADKADFKDTGVQGANDPFDASYVNGTTTQSLTTVDKQLMNALGFTAS